MSRWLTCAICGRRKLVGIMSAQAWATVEGGSRVAHACPECQAKTPGWREQVARIANGSG